MPWELLQDQAQQSYRPALHMFALFSRTLLKRSLHAGNSKCAIQEACTAALDYALDYCCHTHSCHFPMYACIAAPASAWLAAHSAVPTCVPPSNTANRHPPCTSPVCCCLLPCRIHALAASAGCALGPLADESCSSTTNNHFPCTCPCLQDLRTCSKRRRCAGATG
jgi:hypothetical protein